MKKLAVIQARMTSTRLPGKVLKEIFGKPLLEYQLLRLARCKLIDEIIIATTINPSDEPIVALCERLGIPYYRGSENDVLSRYHEGAVKFDADVIIRLTSDCPIIDPQVVDKVIENYLTNESKYDYVSNTLERSYPRGMDTEVFSMKVLQEAYIEAKENFQREHVTPFIYGNPQRYKIGNVRSETDFSNHRWTVDTPEDFDLITKIITKLDGENSMFTMGDIIELLNQNPQWSHINAHIDQKKLTE